MCECRECGGLVPENLKSEAVFCSPKCRATFNNRRATRGAELYDLFMAMRYEREQAKHLTVWGFMCRLAQFHREDDIRQRQGRKSWVDPKTVTSRKPWVRALVVARRMRA